MVSKERFRNSRGPFRGLEISRDEKNIDEIFFNFLQRRFEEEISSSEKIRNFGKYCRDDEEENFLKDNNFEFWMNIGKIYILVTNDWKKKVYGSLSGINLKGDKNLRKK